MPPQRLQPMIIPAKPALEAQHTRKIPDRRECSRDIPIGRSRKNVLSQDENRVQRRIVASSHSQILHGGGHRGKTERKPSSLKLSPTYHVTLLLLLLPQTTTKPSLPLPLLLPLPLSHPLNARVEKPPRFRPLLRSAIYRTPIPCTLEHLCPQSNLQKPTSNNTPRKSAYQQPAERRHPHVSPLVLFWHLARTITGVSVSACSRPFPIPRDLRA